MAAADPTPSEQGDDTPETTPLRARSWAIPVVLALVAIAAALGIGVGIGKLKDSRTQTVTFVVPKGTSVKALTEPVEIMPSKVELHVGDTLVVRNDDTETATVGPFTVRPGETLRQHFQQPQTLVGECSLSGSGTVQIVVT